MNLLPPVTEAEYKLILATIKSRNLSTYTEDKHLFTFRINFTDSIILIGDTPIIHIKDMRDLVATPLELTDRQYADLNQAIIERKYLERCEKKDSIMKKIEEKVNAARSR